MKHKPGITAIRLVCKLLNDPAQSHRHIAHISGVSTRTIKRIQIKLNTSPVDIESVKDNELLRALGQTKTAAHTTSAIDWQTLHNDMQKRDMTLQLAWEEYRCLNNEGISYSQYCRQYGQWRKTVKISLRSNCLQLIR